MNNETATTEFQITQEEARKIVKEAYIYGFPIVDNCRVQYSYFADKRSGLDDLINIMGKQTNR